MFGRRSRIAILHINAFVVSAMVGLPALADFNHQFPGKGSLVEWQRSRTIEEQAFDAEDHADYQKAERLYREAIRIYPHYAGDYFNLGLFLNHRKRYKEAESFLRKSIELQPVFQNWDELGKSLGWQGRLTEAKVAFEKAKPFAKKPKELQGISQNQEWIMDLMHQRSK